MMRRRHATALAMSTAIFGAAVAVAIHNTNAGTTCGSERWAVKVATDTAAKTIRTTPHPSTVAQLDAVVPPSSPTTRVKGLEDQVVTVHATLTDFKVESDHDYHLAITDQAQTMIAEIPDPACVSGSRFAKKISSSRAAFDAKYHASTSFTTVLQPVTITGVVFIDRIHGQRGVGPHGLELHPVLAIAFH